MPFITLDKPGTRIVPGTGPKDASIVIVGEAPGAYEDAQLKPFVGPAGGVLEQCLHAAGLIRSEVYLTNVVKERPPGNDITPFYDVGKNKFSEEGIVWMHQLWSEILEIRPKVVVACGATSFSALTGLGRILKYRGYVFYSKALHGLPVIPCLHPAYTLRGQYTARYLIAADLKKAKHISEHGASLPERQLVCEFAHVGEALEWLSYYEEQEVVCFDTEVVNYEVSCIGFSSSPDIACSIPLAGRWNETDELLVWRAIQRVLGNPRSIKIAQNGIFDAHFLLTRCGIEVRGELRDTMIAHSVMFPELLKGLAFLGSLYCGTQPYWKDLVKFDDIKQES